MKKFILSVIALVIIAGVCYWGWNWWQGNRQELPPIGELVEGNGQEVTESSKEGFSLSDMLAGITGKKEETEEQDQGFSLSGLLGNLGLDNQTDSEGLNIKDILGVIEKADIDLGQVVSGITSGDTSALDGLKDKLSSISIEDLQSMGIYNIDEQTVFDSGKEIHTEELSEVNLGYDIHELDLKIGGCVVTLIPTAGADYYLSAKDYGQLQYSVEKQVLTILSAKSSGELQDMTQGEIKIYVPEDLPLRKLKAEVAAGVLNIEEKFIYDTELSVNAGVANMGQLQGHTAKITLNAGEVKMVADLATQLDVKNSMGNMEITLSGKQTDFNYKVSSAMGNVDLGTLDYSGAASGDTVNNGAGKQVNLENSMGNVTITFTE